MKHVIDELLAREVATATFTDVRTVRRVLVVSRLMVWLVLGFVRRSPAGRDRAREP